MTRKEFKELATEAHDIISKLTSEFRKQIQELYVIAQEKGYGTEFSWVEGEVACPDEDDFETEEEYEEAEEEYYANREGRIDFVTEGTYNIIPYEGYSFVIDEQGNVFFTSVVNEGEFEDDVRIMFEFWAADNWKACTEIIGVIEYELGL
jgi:hypothetical protein